MTQRYLNSAQAAEYLGFGTGARGAGTIRVMVHRRQIEHIKIGARLRFDRLALDAWMRRLTVKAWPQDGSAQERRSRE